MPFIKSETDNNHLPDFTKSLASSFYNNKIFNYFTYTKYPNFVPQNNFDSNNSFINFDSEYVNIAGTSTLHQNYQDYFYCQKKHDQNDGNGEQKCLSYNNINLQNVGQMWNSDNNTSNCLQHEDFYESSKELCLEDTFDISCTRYSDDSTGNSIFLIIS